MAVGLGAAETNGLPSLGERPLNAPLPLLDPGFRAEPDPDAEVEAVTLDGFALRPLGDLATADKAWEIHPVALVGAAWDSNPLQQFGQADPDLQLRLAAGLGSRFIGRDGWRTDLMGILRSERFHDTPSRDFTGGDASLRVRRNGRDTRLALDGSWIRDAAPVYALPEQVERDRLAGRLTLELEQRRGVWSIGAGASRLDYLQDTTEFDRDERDTTRLDAFGGWRLLGGAGTSLGLLATGATVEYPSGAAGSSHVDTSLEGLWRHAAGARTVLELRAGASRRQHEDQTFLRGVGSARLVWAWEDRSWLSVAASSALADGLNEGIHAARRNGLAISTSIRLLDRLDLVGNAWAVRSANLETEPGGERLHTDSRHLRIGPDFRLREGLGLRLWVEWHRQSAPNGDSYERTLTAIELLAAL